jgi:hypothetical protein
MAAVSGEKQSLLAQQPATMGYGGTDAPLASGIQTQIAPEVLRARAMQIIAASQAAAAQQQPTSPIAATALPILPLQGSSQNPVADPANLARAMKDAMEKTTASPPAASAKPTVPSLPVVAAERKMKLAQGLYEGDVLDGVPHGRGTLTFYPGMQYKKYEGEWRKNEAHGRGVLRYTNGDTFEGQWQEGLLHGHVVLTYANGARYEGGCVKGKKHGRGSFRDPDGNTYVGDYVEGKRHGQGKYKKPNGDYYEGGWKDDKQHGQGEETRGNGYYRYSGGWENNARNGQGTYWCGSVIAEGIFRNGGIWTGKSTCYAQPFFRVTEYEEGVQRGCCYSNCSLV